MSTPLPVALRSGIIEAARTIDGRVRCARCGKAFAEIDIEVDHIVPEADGGSHDAVNLQALCAPKAGAGCHRIKSREEAKARAARARASEPAGIGTWLFILLTFSGCLATAWGTFLLVTDHPIRPYTAWIEHWIGVLLAVFAVLAISMAILSMAIHGLFVPGAETPAPPSGAPLAPKPQGSLPVRARAALATIMGDDISTAAAGDGVSVQYGKGFADHEDNARLKALQRVNAKMGGRWEPFWDTENDRVTFLPRPPFPARAMHPGLAKGRPYNKIPISPLVTIDLLVTSHVLLVGPPGAGKTSGLRSCVMAAVDSAQRELADVVLFDPKRVELVGFRGWPGVTAVVTDDQALWDQALELKADMDERHRLFDEEKVPLTRHKRRIIIIDEFKSYCDRMNDWWLALDPVTSKPRKRSGETAPPPVAAIRSMLALSRAAGIHLILATQRPDAKWFSGDARDNAQCRIGFGPLSLDAARMAFGRGDVGRDLPLDAKGRATIQMLDGAFIEDQTYWVPDPSNSTGKNTDEDWQILERLKGVAA